MGVAQPKHKVSIDEYLKIEANSELRYEFHHGDIYSMAGGTIEHGDIASNVHTFLKSSFRASKKGCRSFHSDQKVYIKEENSFLYPDAFAACGDIEKSEKGHAICNPVLIVEVLSKSTAEYDRSEKFDKYRKLPSLREYVLIDQEKFIVEIFFKPAKADLWKITRYEGADKIIHFESVDVKMTMKEIYEDVFSV